jgi:DNA-binding transcriptional LysR family regulator
MREKKSHFNGRVPPLNSLRVFEAAARHGSFVRAAGELHVTHGAVSRQVKQLESSLGVDLFERRNRAVFLTRHGTQLFAACSDAMGRIAEVIDQLRAPAALNPLVVSCEPTIAMRWLIPRLPGLRERFPEHRLHLLTAGGHVDFVRDRVDVALRRNDFNWGEGCYAERVAPELMGPVCSPELAAALKGRQRATMRLLHARTRPSGWTRWFETTGRSLASGEVEHFEHFYLCLQAATAGLGVALGSVYMVEDDVRAGRLVAPFGFTPDGSEYVLLSPVRFDGDERRMQFLDWLRQEMGRSRAEVE